MKKTIALVIAGIIYLVALPVYILYCIGTNANSRWY